MSRNLSPPNFVSTLFPASPFSFVVSSFFPSSPRSHSRLQLSIKEHFKRLRCRSYWFLCLGCGALGDSLKDEAPVVFLSKPPRSACQSEVRGARTRERIRTGRRNIYPRLCAKHHAKMKHNAGFISKKLEINFSFGIPLHRGPNTAFLRPSKATWFLVPLKNGRRPRVKSRAEGYFSWPAFAGLNTCRHMGFCYILML